MAIEVSDVESAILNVVRAKCATSLIYKFIESGEFDLNKHSYEIEETLALVAQTLSDAFCTLNDNSVQFTVKN